MPREGYEFEDDSHLDKDELLNRFDPEIRAELASRMDDDTFSEAHVAHLYRLVSAAPEERDPDMIAEILDATHGMEVDEFAQWVDDRLARWKDR